MSLKETGDNATANKQDAPSPQGKAQKPQKKDKDEEELSEEDSKLKSDLEMLVERLTDSDGSLYAHSLEQLKESISSSTSSMTAVPKPLKFLHPHYDSLVSAFESWTDPALKSKFADILSVLSMTHSDNGKYDALKFRLISQEEDYTNWGHEYIRHLALEIGEASAEIIEEEGGDEAQEITPKLDQVAIKKIVLKTVPFFLKHNQEADAIDLLLETDSISELPQFVDKNIFKRVGLYLVSCVPLLPPPDDLAFLQTAYTIYLEHGELTQALALAIRIDSEELIEAVFNATDDLSIKKQLALILSKQNSAFKNEEVQELIDNRRLSEKFHYLAKELNLLDPKVPEDVYKSHLESHSRLESSNIDSAKQNLAASFVNSFLNLGYGSDKLITTDDKWIYKTKGDGMLSTTASIGSIHQWDTESIQILDKYLYSSDEEIKAGALLGMGLTGSGAHDEVDSVLLLLQDYVTNPNKKLAMSAILGLAMAFAGSQNQQLLEMLLPLVSDLEAPVEVSSLSALALGHAFVGTCNGEITDTILQTLLERSFEQLENKWIKFLALGLGLLYIGKPDQVDDVLDTIAAVEHPISNSLKVLAAISAYAGTGNVLEIQGLFEILTPEGPAPEKENENEDENDEDDEADEEKKSTKKDSEGDAEIADAESEPKTTEKDDGQTEEEEKEKTDKADDSLAYAVLGIAIIALGEDIGKAMALRHYGHLLDYGSESIRRAVPLGIGLLSTSNPQVNIIESLSRMSHDQDTDVAINAIFAMGLIGTGTNNARLAQLFRQLASYHSDSSALFTTRIAQGLTHLGKGTLTLNPFNTEGRVLSKVTLASLLTVAVAFLEPKFVLEHHYLLFFLNAAARPRVLITVDEELNELPVTVRVGKAVDVVGQAGNPKTITGWVTQTTPVLLGYGEKAELEENSEYIALSSFLDGIVILKKNPDYVAEEK